MTVWLAIGGAGLVAYLMRVAVPLLASRRGVSTTAVELSRLAAPAAIAALLANSLLGSDAGVPPVRELAALLVGLAVATRTRSIPATIVAGLSTYAMAGAVT